MRNLLRKEMKLSASILSYLFIPLGFMFLLPGYPILLGTFFISQGLFQSFQSAREANDIVFSALLPIAKRDVVKAKYIFVCLIQICGTILMIISTLLRMTVFSDVLAYRNNALMNANFFAVGMALIVFAWFNLIFVRGFFKTAYKFGLPYVTFIIVSFLTILIAEALHHIPGLERLNAFGTDALGLQLSLFAAGLLIYLVITVASCLSACRHFEKLDL